MAAAVGRKDQILRVAEQLFARQGYHATSIREIAAALQLEGGSLYSHISSKQQLLYTIVLRASEHFLAAGQAAEQITGGAEAQLRGLMRAHLAIIAESIDGAVVYFHEWRHLDAHQQATITAHRDAYEGYLRRILVAGMQAGVFAKGDSALTSKYLFSLLNWSYQWFRPAGPLSAEQLADQYYAMAMRGLEVKG